jgi:hypothetical protein
MWPDPISDTQYTVARARGNPTCSIVSLQWLLDSDKAGTPLPVKPYRLDTATVATPSPARNADFPSDNPTPAAQQQDTENTIESPGFHEHLFTFQVNLAQPGSGAQNVEEHDGINASERPTKKRRVRRAELEAENDDQIDTFADDSVAVSEAQPATPLGQPHTGAAARQTPVQSPNNEEEDSNYLDSSYGQQQVLDHGFHHAVYPALYPNPTTGLNMMPAAETHTQAHVEQAADTQGHAETTYSLEDVNNSPEQQSHGQEHGFDQNHQQPPYHTHNHPAATNATSMIPVTTAQDLIRNGQCPANYPAPQQQPEPARARDRLLPIPSYARSTWNEFHAVWAGDHSALKLEQERLRAGGLQIQYYNPTAGEPLYVPGYVDPEYPHACEYHSIPHQSSRSVPFSFR